MPHEKENAMREDACLTAEKLKKKWMHGIFFSEGVKERPMPALAEFRFASSYSSLSLSLSLSLLY
jgi:hypothetical protein